MSRTYRELGGSEERARQSGTVQVPKRLDGGWWQVPRALPSGNRGVEHSTMCLWDG